jgi:hypothetical protein
MQYLPQARTARERERQPRQQLQHSREAGMTAASWVRFAVCAGKNCGSSLIPTSCGIVPIGDRKRRTASSDSTRSAPGSGSESRGWPRSASNALWTVLALVR